MHLCVFILYLFCTILSLHAQGIPSLTIPSGDALTLDGTTQVVLPKFLFGGPFTVEAWVLANFNASSDAPGPLLYFGNEDDADKIEIGIDAGGYLYLELEVSDRLAFAEQIPTDPTVLAHITPFITTPLGDVYGTGPLVRRVQFQIPASLSGQWLLIDIKEASNGVITFFINHVQVFQTSPLDIPVLPMYLFRTFNFIGANPTSKFVGNLQALTLWNRGLSNNDITSGNTIKLNDGGMVGRWDFSFVVNGVVINQVADAKESVSKATQDIQRQLDALQAQLATAQESYKAAQAQAAAIIAAASPADLASAKEQAQQIISAALLILNEAQAAIDQAKRLPNAQGVVSSDKGFKSTAQLERIKNIREQANSGSGDPAYIASQIQMYAQAAKDHTTNTASDLATIASAFTPDTNVWLNAALNGLNKLPYRATSANARSVLQTNQVAPSGSVRNSATIESRLDGIISQEGRKRSKNQATRGCVSPTWDLQCTWCNDPHFTLKTVNNSWSRAYDYMSPSCHWILLSGEVMIQEQSYKCNGNAGCIGSVGAFVDNRWVVIFSNDNSITVNGVKINTKCLPYTLDSAKGIKIEKTSYGNTLTTPLYELFFTGSAGVRFNSHEYWNADNHSICVNKVHMPGKPLPPSYYDVIQPGQCFLDFKNFKPNATEICPVCQNGGTPDFNLVDGCHCECQDGWTGDNCENFYCRECVHLSGNCTGPNQCTCNTTDPSFIFGGPDCAAKCRRDQCLNNGTVRMNTDLTCSCECPYGWWGADCGNPLCPTGPNGRLCSGYGTCETNGTCTCIPNVSFGESCAGNCTAQICPSADGQECGGHGSCECGACICDRDFGGDACNVPDCTNVTSTPDSNGCGSHGECMGDQSVPYCACNPGWRGDRCEEFFCSNCSADHGTCTEAPLPFCTCDKGWTSASCSEFTCDFLSNCTRPKGQCVYNATWGAMPKCECGPHWTGDDCTTPICLNECSHQGTCVDSPAGSADPPVCQCDTPWIGEDCSVLPDCDSTADPDSWSSPEWEARATEICNNASFIDPMHNVSCLYDAQQLDNYEILYSLAYQKYLNCKLEEVNGGDPCGTLCPNFCSFNGLCELDGVCTCDPGFFGLDCSLQVNRRTYYVEYNGGNVHAEISQVLVPAAPATHLAISAGATHTTNEVANAAVAYLYQDYRPLFGQCKPYNDLYLVVLMDQAASSCTSGGTYKFSVSSSEAGAIPLVLGHHCTSELTAPTTTTFSCSWAFGANAAVVAGPLSQNTSWTLNFALPFGECITSLYYASESLTGITDLTPVPPAQASDFKITSGMSNSHCGTITDCGACMAAEDCGWCPDIGYCMEGTASGPTIGMCSVWRYSTDAEDSRVIGTSGFYRDVVPSNVEVYLVPGSTLEVPISVIVPKKPTIEVQFLVDLSAGMAPVVNTLSAQAANLFSTLVDAYPSSEVALASFIDKPVEPYGTNVTGDYVYYSKLLMTDDVGLFEDTVSDLVLGHGGDEPNAQLEALLQAALRSTATGFIGSRRVVVMITGTPYHVPPTDFSVPNNLDTITDIYEDYPYISDVRTALINANILPVFVVTDSTWYANYTDLVQQIGFGFVVQAPVTDLVTPTMNGLAHALSTITLQAASTKFVGSIYPTSYSSIQPLSRVQFTVTLDRSATKRYELFDASLTLTAPGFGTVTFNLSSSDVPVGDAQLVSLKQGAQVVITLGGDNVYHTELIRTIASLPAGGILLQYDTKDAINTVGTEVTDPSHRVIYIPDVNGSCSYIPGEYCSRRRAECTPCPYDAFSYSLVDSCACRSTNITVTLDVLANVVNNRPIALMPTQPSTLQDTALPITLTGFDRDNDTLWTIVISLPTKGQLYEGATNITQAMLPYNATSRVVTYVPPFHRWGDDFDSFAYYVNDGHEAHQLGNSEPITVSINVILTDSPPVVYNLSFTALENNNVLITLRVEDPDQTDFDNGWIHVFILDFPNATQGILRNMDGTLITEHANYVTDTVHWQIIFVPTTYSNGNPLFTFRYRAYDSQLYSDDAYVDINITPVNQIPINLTPESIEVYEDTPYNITFSCWDPEADEVAWTIISPPTIGTLVDVVGGNVRLQRRSVMVSTWALYTPPKDSTQLTAFTYYPNDRPGSSVITATHQMTIFVIPVNDAPTLTATTRNFTRTVAASGSTSVTVNNITVADVDVDLNFMTVNISLTGSGSITLTPPNPAVLQNLTTSPNFITFSARLPDINTLFRTALTYTIQDTLGLPSYLGTIFVSVTDNGFVGQGGPGYANTTITVQTTVQPAAQTSLALSLGALGVGVASAAGIGGVYKVLKYKNVFGEESDPFAHMGQDEQLDVVMENPLYQPSPRNSLQ